MTRISSFIFLPNLVNQKSCNIGVSAKALEEMKTGENQLFKQDSCQLILSYRRARAVLRRMAVI